MRERILDKALELFFRYGVKSVSMDDIAREIGASKKTIYQHFDDKEAIVLAVVQNHFEQERCNAERMQSEAADPIAEVVATSEQMRQMLTDVNPTMLFDLKKYYPVAWQAFIEFKNGFILNIIKKNLLMGIEAGLYRADTNVEVLARMRGEQVDLGFDQQVFPASKFNIIDTQLVFLDHFIRGIVTEKGLKMYQEYKQPINSQLF